MNYLSFYNESYKYLVEKAKEHHISEEELQKYFTPQTGNGKLFDCYGGQTLENLLFRFAFHAQNGGQISKVIKFPQNPADPRRKQFESVFCNFDPGMLISTYSTADALFDVFVINLGMPRISSASKTNDYRKSMPYKYCKSVLSAARFVSKFADYDDFAYKIISLGEMAPLYISLEVSGFAIPLACDIIKELGLGVDLPKPDVHILKIFYGLGFLQSDSGTEAQYNCIKIMNEVVNAIKTTDSNITSYKIDKVLWLISTETFYDDDNIRNYGSKKREEYLKYIKSFC